LSLHIDSFLSLFCRLYGTPASLPDISLFTFIPIKFTGCCAHPSLYRAHLHAVEGGNPVILLIDAVIDKKSTTLPRTKICPSRRSTELRLEC
jgi:hypothetical protein